MLHRVRQLLLAVALFVPSLAVLVTPLPAGGSPADDYAGPYFGAGNLPPGCTTDMAVSPDNICHRMRTDMNGLDSPQVDVLVMVPVSPTAERDMRIMRQSVEMWEAGIDYLADEMDLGWLAEGMDFHITVDVFDPVGGNGGEFTTYPIVDPEIVVIATNPVGGAGIGVDPVDFVFLDEDLAPCHNVQNPFDFEHWENLPGFDSHHDGRSGTYVEDCGGAGGNICFAINGAIDPAPEVLDVFGLFDLVSHEFGHCLTIGHVGDGLEGTWGALPSNDIMAYSQDPPGGTKCVSTLDVEGIALRMSKYLDVNGDGTIDFRDRLQANDPVGDGDNPFQVQHPDDHLYASSTGSPFDCPQPDLGLVPGPRTEWTPTPAQTVESVLDVTSPADGTSATEGTVNVTGTVERRPLNPVTDPTQPTGSFDDADDDGKTPITEITRFDAEVTDTHVKGVIRLAELYPPAPPATPTTYSFMVNGRRFDSFVYGTQVPSTYDRWAGAYMAAGWSAWDTAAKTVSFAIPRSYLAGVAISAPYTVYSSANVGPFPLTSIDDLAPEPGHTVGLAAPSSASMSVASAPAAPLPGVDLGIGPRRPATTTQTVTFEREGGNSFTVADSTLGVTYEVADDTRHHFPLTIDQPSRVELSLRWTDGVKGNDLDLYASGGAGPTGAAVDSGGTGATAFGTSEAVVFEHVSGTLDLVVEPYLITDPVAGATYTLTATVHVLGVDSDGDGVSDLYDVCPSTAGDGADGCPIEPTEQVKVLVAGGVVGSQIVDTVRSPDTFDIPLELPEGTHELVVVWERRGQVVAEQAVTYTHASDGGGGGTGSDTDGDGVTDDLDNCPEHANPEQANMDDDAKGDVCDPDRDGDSHNNKKEIAKGTDPDDPNSYPAPGGRSTAPRD